jgi:hypothetical protein
MTDPVDYTESPFESIVNVHWPGAIMAVVKVNCADMGSYEMFGNDDLETFISSVGDVTNGTMKHEDMIDYCVTTGANQGDVVVEAFDETNFEIIDIAQMSSTTTGFDPTHSGQSETAYELGNLTEVDGHRGYLSLDFVPPSGETFPAGIGAWADYDYEANGINPAGPWVIWGNHITNHHDTAYSEKSLWICDFGKPPILDHDYSGTGVENGVTKFTVRRWVSHPHSEIDVIPESYECQWELKIYPAGTVFTISNGTDYTANKPATFSGTSTSTAYGEVETIFTFDKNGFVL